MAKRKTTKAMKSIIIVFFILIILIAVVGLAVSIKDKTEVSVSTFSLSVNGDISKRMRSCTSYTSRSRRCLSRTTPCA